MIPQPFTVYLTKILRSLVLCCMLALSACSSSPKKEAPVRSEQAYYSSAQAALKAKNYFLAVEHLRNIETHYPFGKYTAQAQLDLIYSHFQSGSYQSEIGRASCRESV